MGLLLMLLSLPSDKNAEVDRQREQYEKLKWQLERKLQELDGELALQRQVGGAPGPAWTARSGVPGQEDDHR